MPAERAQAGQRCALNLTGTDLETVARGDWVLAEAIHAPDAAHRRARHAARVRDASRSSTGRRCTSTSPPPTSPPASRFPRERRDRARRLRHRAARARQAGWRAERRPLHPARPVRAAARWAAAWCSIRSPARRAAPLPRAQAELAALERGSPEAALAELLKAASRGRGPRAVRANIQPEAGARRPRSTPPTGVAVLGEGGRASASPGHDRDRLRERMLARAGGFPPRAAAGDGHRDPRRCASSSRRSCRRRRSSRSCASWPTSARSRSRATPCACPGTTRPRIPRTSACGSSCCPRCQRGGFAPPTVAELAAALKLKEAALKDFLHRKSRGGEVMRVPPDRFYPRATLAALAATAHCGRTLEPERLFTAAQYRDATGIGSEPGDRDPGIPRHPRHHAAHRRRAQDAQGLRPDPGRGRAAAARNPPAAPNRQARTKPASRATEIHQGPTIIEH